MKRRLLQLEGATLRLVPRVVVVGGGFGGLLAVRGLRRADVEVTLVDRQNFYLFQPLAYQVATGSLSSAEVAIPLRQILRRQRNARVVLGAVDGFDLEARRVSVASLPNGGRLELDYDTLVVAGGARYSYFGHDDWAPYAPELKSLEGALDLRDRILRAFEAAEVEEDETSRAEWLTFVVVGAGPTGVEMAGQIAELGKDVLHNEYRTVDTRRTRVLLVEATGRVLGAFPPSLSKSAERQLRSLGRHAAPRDDGGRHRCAAVEVEGPDGARSRIAARTVVWAAGVTASTLAGLLAAAAGVETDRAGRVTVEPDLTLPGHPEVFALGDMVTVRGQQLHGVAPVAMQQGRHAARSIAGGSRTPFRYRDKGELATIGRSRAVGVIGGRSRQRVRRLAALARRPHHVPRRRSEPSARPDAMDVQLRDSRPQRPRDPPHLSLSRHGLRHCARGGIVGDGREAPTPREPRDTELLEVGGPGHPLSTITFIGPSMRRASSGIATGRTEDRIRAVGAGGEVGIRPLDRVFDVAAVRRNTSTRAFTTSSGAAPRIAAIAAACSSTGTSPTPSSPRS